MFATEESPANMHGLLQIIVAQYAEHETAVDVFRSGKGRPWGDQHPCQFCGTDRFFRPGYVANLVTNWITALDGVQEKLEAGGTIADIGCGHGSSTVLMAETFPNSKVFGYDIHGPSIEDARSKATAADGSGRPLVTHWRSRPGGRWSASRASRRRRPSI